MNGNWSSRSGIAQRGMWYVSYAVERFILTLMRIYITLNALFEVLSIKTNESTGAHMALIRGPF